MSKRQLAHNTPGSSARFECLVQVSNHFAQIGAISRSEKMPSKQDKEKEILLIKKLLAASEGTPTNVVIPALMLI